MDRGIQTSVAGLELAKKALKLKGWTQDHLAGASGCTRQTISKFLAGKAIEQRIFQSICAELGLAWGEIAAFDESVKPSIQIPGIDTLVQEIREKISASIQKRCGTMRVLDMEQPITIDSIYTNVNILDKISRNQRRSIEELLDGCDLEDFDRFTLGRVKTERIPGLEAVQRHEQLMILGKPGAGKTTFLKWLALQCHGGQLYAHRVPFFVTLKEFSEAEGKPTLIGFMARQLLECQVQSESEVVEQILQTGRSIILLDGLDEVREEDHDRVLANIREVSRQFNQNQFIITCRIAAKEYTFEQFTEVEVADFNEEQIADFVFKWFQPKDPIKAQEFPQELKSYPGLPELATNPLLLTLLCLVYEEQGGFPVNRSEIYAEGLNVLLKKWDVKRNIKRAEVYKKLSLKRKEDLLSRVAYRTFVQSEYFFKQKFVEGQIQDYICNLPNASDSEEALQLDGEAVLKSIEAQHGLLVERARSIYSFSHLTFQEYFTARYFKEKSNNDFSVLVNHIAEKRWREIFLLTVGMLDDADRLLMAMKQHIDGILSGDRQLQQFLVWLERKVYSMDVQYKFVAVRAYYFSLARDLDLSLDRALALALDRALARALDLALALANEVGSIELKRSLQEIKDQLPNLSGESKSEYNLWWKTNGQEWTKQFRAIMIEHRDIGHDWQFSEAQEKLLQQYYDANKLLVDCLNSDCYVSREVRSAIEDTLLLPISSIQARQNKS